MYETARKYSEHMYCTKEYVLKEMDSYLVDPIWQEIKTYRSFFRRDLHWNEKPYYLIQNTLVVNQTLQVENMLMRYETIQTIHDDLLYCPYLSDQDNERFLQYMHYLMIHPHIHITEFLHSFFQQFQIQDIYKEHLEFLLNEEEPFLLRLYSLFLIDSKRSQSLLYFPFLIMHKMIKVHTIFKFHEMSELYSTIEEQDITYGYLDLLNKLYLSLHKNMVLLKADNEVLTIHLQEQDLIECYPALRKEQIQFYIQHRSVGHYYTIQDYIQMNQVCYETARYSLDQLVELRWYDKMKIGKKFVYYVV